MRDSTVTAKRLAEANDAGRSIGAGEPGATNKVSFSSAAASKVAAATGRRTSATSTTLDRGVNGRAVSGNRLLVSALLLAPPLLSATGSTG